MEVLELVPQPGLVPLLVALLILLAAYVSSLGRRSHQKEPPGPKALPIVGNLVQLDFRNPWKTLVEVSSDPSGSSWIWQVAPGASQLQFSKKYGPVFTVYMGGTKVVVLAGYRTVRQALVQHADVFGHRHHMLIMQEFVKGHGIIWSNGDGWREMRRFALANLKNFGMGRKGCEDKIVEESQHLREVLKSFRGEAFDTWLPVYCAISNVICSVVYGNRFDYQDQEFKTLVENTRRRTELMFSSSVQMYNLFPGLLKWISNRGEFHRLSASSQQKNLEIITHLKKTLDPQRCRGFIDAFLVHMQSLEESGVTKSHFHQDNLLYTIMNLFAAGTDTTAVTLRWGLLLMAKHPQIQNQVQEELSRVVGHRQVLLEDRKNLHFTNAVVHEIQRVANVAPTALPHVTSQDVVFQGYFIKKGTVVYPLLAAVLCDEEEWEQPHTFHPAHFLDQEAKFVKPDAFMPFSAGPRACPGEALARMELFIFLASLLQHFCFSPAPGVSPEQLLVASAPGSASIPLAHQLCALPRP